MKRRIVYFRDLLKRNFKTNLMRIKHLLLLTTAALLLSITAFAQRPITKADQAFENQAYFEAAKLYKSVEPNVKDIKEKGRILYNIAECYRLATDYTQSLEWYNKALTAQYYNTNADVYLNHGIALQNLGKWEDATTQFNKYVEKGGTFATEAKERIKNCKLAADKKNEKPKLIVENMAELNSPFFDFSMVFSSKRGDEIMFSSSRQASTGSGEDPITGESFMDLFFAERDKKGKFGVPSPAIGGVSSKSNEGAACFTKDYGDIYYTLCEYNDSKDYDGYCDILRSKRGGSSYGMPDTIKLVDRSTDEMTTIGHPALTQDEKYLIFASDMAGGKGGRDLWYSTYDKKSDSWSNPTNMTAVNSAGDDMFPYIAEDGTLYFSSNGRGGMGGLDIYKAEKKGDIDFGNIVAMDYPINSSSDDFSFILEKNKESGYMGYFTSNRPGGKGKDDLYSVKEPPLVFRMTGIAYNKTTGGTLSDANVTVKGSDGSDFKLTTDGNGGFSLDEKQLKPNVNYTVQVDKDGHIGTGDSFSTNSKTSLNIAKDYFLIPIIKDEVYEMPSVLFIYTKKDLLIDNTVNSQDSLNYLLDIMKKNPKLVIQLEAHTDARGDEKSNLTLSNERAKTCTDYLTSKGIDPARMKSVGKGESEPRKLTSAAMGFPAGTVLTEAYINALPADQHDAAHTLNRRVIFKVIGTDFVPKK
jgi:peptidoglycan-associated lipoprotein